MVYGIRLNRMEHKVGWGSRVRSYCGSGAKELSFRSKGVNGSEKKRPARLFESRLGFQKNREAITNLSAPPELLRFSLSTKCLCLELVK